MMNVERRMMNKNPNRCGRSFIMPRSTFIMQN